MHITTCPECGAPAEVQWRAVVGSTAGPTELAKVLCVRRHWFLLPVAMLAASERAHYAGASAGVSTRRR